MIFTLWTCMGTSIQTGTTIVQTATALFQGIFYQGTSVQNAMAR